MRVLGRVPQREAVIAGIVFGDRRARLDRVGREPVVAQIEPRHVPRGAERRIGRLRVAEMPFEDRVVRRDRVNLRRVGRLRARRIDHRRQHLVVDRDLLGRVARLRQAFGDHDRDRLAGITGLAARERRMRRHLHRRAVFRMNHPAANETAELGGGEVLAGEDGEHARHRRGGARLHMLDGRVRMRRADEHRVRLTGPGDVVGVLAPPGDETEILLASHRCAHACRAHGPNSSPARFLCNDRSCRRSVAFVIRRPAAPLRPTPSPARRPRSI